MNAADFANHLHAKPTSWGWSAKCPAHDDRHASLSISEGNDGTLLLKCHAGCTFEQIMDAAKVERTKLNGESNGQTHAKPHIVATYDYTDAKGQLLFQVVRMAPKDFRQRRPDGNGDWIWKMTGVERVPYRLPEIIEASELFVCEGEKDCDRLAKLGLVATTNPGGAGKWPETFGRWFDGRHITILPDNDKSGRDHAQDVAAKLKDSAASMRILDLPGLADKGDVSDWIDAGGTVAELQAMAAAAPFWDPNKAAEVEPWPFTLASDLKPNLTSNDLIKDLIPRNAFGEVHADSGGGKTAILIDMMLHLAAGLEYRGRRVEQQPVVYVALEGHAGINNRVIAALKNLGIDEPVQFALVKISGNFREPEAAKRTAAVAKKLKQQFGGDCPVIVIDTYTAALDGGSDCDPKDVGAFIENIKRELLACGATVAISHHFGKDSSRGGRGWSGLGAALDFELEIDRDDDLRIMRITKSRDGSDQQPGLCYRLHGRVLGINEHGELVTAVVVEHLADEDTTRRGKRYSPKARAALNVLWECIKDPSRSFPLPDQPRLRCVLLSTWQDACIAPGAISNCHRERDRKLKFKSAMDELLVAQAIVADTENGERIYPAPARGATGATNE